MKIFGTLCLLFAFNAFAQEAVDLKPYYKNLDYFNLDQRRELLDYEAKFTSFLKANLDKKVSELNAKDAKNILYGTLFLTNTNQGLRFKQISYDEIISHGSLSEKHDLKSEMLAREELILANLKMAQKILPDDFRIESWIGTHQMYQEELMFGSVSEKTFEMMFKLSKENVFNYTAMAVISNELNLSESQQKRMVELAQMVSDDKIPCVKQAATGKCYDHKLAPQTAEIGKLITGDIYLKEASRFVEGKVDAEGKRIQAGVSARVIYGLVVQKKYPNYKGLDWSNIYMKARVKSVNALLWKQTPVDKAMTESMGFKRAYSCFACHSGAK